MTEPQLDLCFARRGNRTVLAHRYVSYPFFVAAPLRGAEVILQSVSGGLFGGDRIAQQVVLGDGAEAVIRMPSAMVVHHRRGKPAACQSVALRVGEGTRLLYLPRPAILLPGSGVVQSMEITLGRHAAVLILDGFLMHNPGGHPSEPRALESCVTIRDASGRLIALDRMRVTDEMLTTADPGVAGGYRAFGTAWLLQEMENDAWPQARPATWP
jgi:urease accessory protein